MKNIYKSISLFIIVTIILSFSGCRKMKDINSSFTSQITPDMEYTVSASKTGEITVIDKNGNIIEDAVINEDGSLNINGKIVLPNLVKHLDTVIDAQEGVISGTSEGTVNKIDASPEPTVSNPQNSASVPINNNSNNDNTSAPINNNSNNSNTSTPINNNNETVVPPAQSETGTPVQTLTPLTDAEIKEAEDYFLQLVNEERARVGVAPLSRNATLDKAANIRVNETLTVWGHTRPNGKTWSTVFNDVEYGIKGENIWSDDGVNWNTEIQYNLGPSGEILNNAGGYSILDISRPTPKDIGKRIFEAYKVSLGHYNNIIGSDYNFVGTSIISYKSETNDKIICHNITIFSGN